MSWARFRLAFAVAAGASAAAQPAPAPAEGPTALRQACQAGLEGGLTPAEFDELAPRVRAQIAAAADPSARLSAIKLAADLCWNVSPCAGDDLRGAALEHLLALPESPRARAMLVEHFLPPLHRAAPAEQAAVVAHFDLLLDRLAASANGDQAAADLLRLRCGVRIEALRAWDVPWLDAAARRQLDTWLTELHERFGSVPSPTDGPYADVATALKRELADTAFGRDLSGMALEDLDGRPVRLADLRGHVVVLSFWSSWCLPCLAMAPEERAMRDRLAGRGVRLLGVNSDATRAAGQRAAQKHEMAWPHIWSPPDGGPRDLASALHIWQWPSAIILDGTGAIRGKFTGSAFQRGWKVADVEQAVLEILDSQPSAATQAAGGP